VTVALEGLRTVIYPAPELDAAKRWWADLLGQEPYFDEAFYVGFEVGPPTLRRIQLGCRVDDGAKSLQGNGHRPSLPRWIVDSRG